MAEAYMKEIVLPSKGQLYNGEIPEGTVAIEPLGTREEKLFSAGADSGQQVINKVFDSCVTSPIDHKDLVLGDRLHLLLQLRSISYGREYQYPFKCDECGKKSYGTIDLDSVPVIGPNGATDPSKFDVTLPIQGHTLTLRLLTGRDEEKVQSYVRQVSSRTRGKLDPGIEYVYRFARRIEAVDGESVGIREAMEVFESLKGEDSVAVRNAIEDHDVGPDIDVEPDCQHCGFPNGPMKIPFGVEFFRPIRRRTGSAVYTEAAERIDAPQDS